MTKNKILAAGATTTTGLVLGEFGLEDLHEKVMVKRLANIPRKLRQKTMVIPGREKDGPVRVVLLPNIPNIKVMAAAGGTSTGAITTNELKEKYPNYFIHRPIPATNIREMTDPYNGITRKMFTDCARTDPTIAPALKKRNSAFFRNGFVLKLKLKSQRSPIDGHILNEDEQELATQDFYKQYLAYLNQLDTWCHNRSIKLLSKIKSAQFVGVVQGRFLSKFFPPLSFLEPGALPLTLKIISGEETGNVVIDRLSEEIVAVRIYSVDEENSVLLPDEFVYGFLNDSALTRYERFYGRADLEPVVQLSRINKHIVNIGYAKAFEAAYLPKVLSKVKVEGSHPEKMQQLKAHADYLVDQGSDVVAIEAEEFTDIQAYPQEVNHEMIKAIRHDIDEIALGIAGSTKAQISRTDELTRDNATIMEIENERNVITPDENVFSEFFETQLLNPLFAHLLGVPMENIPVEIFIDRIPDKEDVLATLDEDQVKKKEGPEPGQNNLEQRKTEEVSSGQIEQPDAISEFGASGKFEERKHLRDNDGKFSEKGRGEGGGGVKKKLKYLNESEMQQVNEIADIIKSELGDDIHNLGIDYPTPDTQTYHDDLYTASEIGDFFERGYAKNYDVALQSDINEKDLADFGLTRQTEKSAFLYSKIGNEEAKLTPINDFLKTATPAEVFLYNMNDLHKTAYDNSEKIEKFHKMWDTVIERNPQLREQMVKAEGVSKVLNDEYERQYSTAKSFYRGTSIDELFNYKQTGKFGTSNNKYDYTAMSLHESFTSEWVGAKGIVIEYDADKIRKDSVLVNYSARPQPIGVSKSIKSGSPDDLTKPMALGYSREAELRVADNVPIQGKIKKITFKGYQPDLGLQQRYGHLGELEFDDSELGASGSDEDIKRVMNLLNISEHDAKIELERLLFSPHKKTISAAGTFKEEDHPRDEDGKFGDGSGSSTKNEEQNTTNNTENKDTPNLDKQYDNIQNVFGRASDIASFSKDQETDIVVAVERKAHDYLSTVEGHPNFGTTFDEKRIRAYAENNSTPAYHNMFAGFNRSTDQNSSVDGTTIKNTWIEAEKIKPELKSIRKDLESQVEQYNKSMKEKLQNAESIYRGIRTEELDAIISKTNKDVEPYGYNYVSLTLGKTQGDGFGKNNNGITMEYNPKMIDDLKTVQYDMYTSTPITQKGEKYPISYADEEEVQTYQISDITRENLVKSITVWDSDVTDETLQKYKTHMPSANIIDNRPRQPDTISDAGAAGEKDGQWITSKGSKIFIKDGEDKGDAVKEHFKKLEKSEKNTNSEPLTDQFDEIYDNVGIRFNRDFIRDDVNAARQLHDEAKMIIEDYNNVVEDNKDELLEKFPNLDTISNYDAYDIMSEGYSITEDKVDDLYKATDFIRSKLDKKSLETELMINTLHKKMLDENKTLFRGTDFSELNNTGKSPHKLGKDHDFVSTSLSPRRAEHFTNFFTDNGIVIQYDMSDAKEGQDFEHVTYRLQPKSDVEREDHNYKPFEKYNGYHDIASSFEMEVHLSREYKPKIKNVHMIKGAMTDDEEIEFQKKFKDFNLGDAKLKFYNTKEDFVYADFNEESDLGAAGDDDDGGQWITSNGHKIFILDGKDKGDAVKEHFKKLEKSEKNTNSETKQDDNGFEILSNQSVEIEGYYSGKEISKEFISNIKETWNNMPIDLRKNIKSVSITGGYEEELEEIMGPEAIAELRNTKGEFNYYEKSLSIYENKQMSESDVVNVMYHEAGHAKFNAMSQSKQKEWIEGANQIAPITYYVKTYEKEKSDEDKFVQRALDKGNESAYNQLKYPYASEQYSDFISAFHGKHTGKINKDSYEKLEKLYFKNDGRQNSSDPDTTKSISAAGDDDDGGQWITSNGHKIFILDGKDKGKATKEYFNNLNKSNVQKNIYSAKEQRVLDLAKKSVVVMTTNKDYEQFVGMVDTLRGKISPELLAELNAQMDLKFTKEDFTDWKKSGKDQKFTVSGFVNKTRAEVVKKAWNDLPDGDRKLLKGFNIKTSKARSSYAAGSFNTKTNIMTFRTHVSDDPSNQQENYYENTIYHEAGHARWHNKYTPEQKEQWKKKVDEEFLHNVTSYSNSFFKTVNTYENAISHLKIRRDSFSRRGYPNIAREAQRDIDEFEKALPHARALAYNETHSEVYGYMNRPTEGDRTRLKYINKDKLAKGAEILNEVFGE